MSSPVPISRFVICDKNLKALKQRVEGERHMPRLTTQLV